ncbi:MAG: alpha-hydroxy-acid oxidizing protein [Methanomassiliicoccaceae archaeon]|nr:alpha-hydroxy-acid oxidizing protein [Methanomassiliicoccaceae archaeon]
MVSKDKVIIDFKPVSPKDGDLFRGRDPIEVARRLERIGILGLSVVTESDNFGGSLKLLRDICSEVELPVLRKDFIKTEADLSETIEAGAKGVLLIVAAAPNISELYKRSTELGLSPVVEVHTAKEMEIAKNMGAKIISINNKNIIDLERDNGTIATTADLIRLAPKDAFIISASGIADHDDAQKALNSGADAVLVGTAFWKGGFEII